MTQNKLKRLKTTQNKQQDSIQTLGLNLDENTIDFDSKDSKTHFWTDLKQVSKGDLVLDEFKRKTSKLKT